MDIVVKSMATHEITSLALVQINRLLKQVSAESKAVSLFDLRALILNDYLFVAKTAGGDIVGMATLIHFKKTTGHVGLIEDVVVDEGMRGRGIGRSLIVAAIDRARSCGLKHINLTSSPKRVAARGLYESLGFQPRNTTPFRLML